MTKIQFMNQELKSEHSLAGKFLFLSFDLICFLVTVKRQT